MKPALVALENDAVTISEHENAANLMQCPITSTPQEPIPFAFSFPVCDLLICEFPVDEPVFVPKTEQESSFGVEISDLADVNIVSRYSTRVPFGRFSTGRTLDGSGIFTVPRVSRVAQYIYQKVIRRKPVPFQPSPKNHKYLLCYVKEELECGHEITVYPHDGETLTARKRNCNECAAEAVGVRPKKPSGSIKKAIREFKQAGHASRPVLGFACLMFVAFTCLCWQLSKHQNTFRYYAPADKFQIVKRYDGFRYDFRWIHAENGKVTSRPIYGHFCEGFMPRLSAGETLTYLAYEDVGSCWLIEGQGLGYDFKKDTDGHISLAPNCHRGERMVECEPVLNEAIFPEEK